MLVHRISLYAVAFAAVLCNLGHTADPPSRESQQNITLMGLLGEWRYPDAKFHGAKMSDAAVKDISSVKCQAVLTTPDPLEKVLAHYRDKLKVDADGHPSGGDGSERVTSDRAVTIQDVSENRTLKLTIIHVHEKRSSTTLTVSRSQGEGQTHISWSHFRQLWPE